MAVCHWGEIEKVRDVLGVLEGVIVEFWHGRR
jgi:hypothetical protein